MKKLKQLGLLMWKNFMLQRRRPVGTLVQIGLPFFMSLIYLLIRLYLIDATRYSAITWPEYSISTPPPTLRTSFSIGYATPNGSELSQEFINNLTYYLNEDTYPNQTIDLQHFPSESVMVNKIIDSSDHNSSKCIGGIYFTTLPGNKQSAFDYTLRFTIPKNKKNPLAKNGHEWLTKYVFPKFQLPQPRNNDSAVGDHPSYYKAGFLFTQYAVDRAIVSQFGAEPATVLMQKFPFPSYIQDAFIFIIQQFMPNFFVIAFIYTALVIVRSIVYEKEKRLKVSAYQYYHTTIYHTIYYTMLITPYHATPYCTTIYHTVPYHNHIHILLNQTWDNHLHQNDLLMLYLFLRKH